MVEQEELRVRSLPEVKAMAASAASEKEPKKPSENLALASKGARADGARRPDLMIDGKTDHETREGFAFGPTPCNFTIDLRSVRPIGLIRFLLYELDSRRYEYRLLISVDGESWEVVGSEKKAKGWQEISLEDAEARYVRINGISNTANNDFHVVEVEVYEP